MKANGLLMQAVVLPVSRQSGAEAGQ
jgi:hypothetical protein